jgi:hypothetical protein
LARDRQYGEAYTLLGAEGIVRETGSAQSYDELWLLYRVASGSGHPGDAVRPLDQAIRSFPGDAGAANAAATLGSLQIDVLNNPRAAVPAFERCLELHPSDALRTRVLSRLEEARRRSSGN